MYREGLVCLSDRAGHTNHQAPLVQSKCFDFVHYKQKRHRIEISTTREPKAKAAGLPNYASPFNMKHFERKLREAVISTWYIKEKNLA